MNFGSLRIILNEPKYAGYHKGKQFVFFGVAVGILKTYRVPFLRNLVLLCRTLRILVLIT